MSCRFLGEEQQSAALLYSPLPPPTLQRIFLVFQRHAERVTQPAYLCLNASGSVNSAYLHTSLNPPLLHSASPTPPPLPLHPSTLPFFHPSSHQPYPTLFLPYPTLPTLLHSSCLPFDSLPSFQTLVLPLPRPSSPSSFLSLCSLCLCVSKIRCVSEFQSGSSALQ